MPVVAASLNYDGPISVSEGASASAKTWLRKDYTWQSFLDRLSIPLVTKETVEEYHAAEKRLKQHWKDCGGYVGGVLKGTSRGRSDVISRQLITLDLDDAENPELLWEMFLLAFGNAAALHSTHSHTSDAPRLRLIIPTKQTLKPDEYKKVSRHIVDTLGVKQFDPTTHEPNRLMFWPSISKDGQYVFEYHDAPWLDAASIIYAEKIENQAIEVVKAVAKKGGAVAEFCSMYNVPDVIERFIPEVYVKTDNDRYKFGEADSSAGLVLYDNGNSAYSHHAKDPAGKYPRTAFDLVRIHKFGHLDGDCLSITPDHERPSYAAMLDWIAAENHCPVSKWYEELARDDDGKIRSTIDNYRQIISNDEELNAAALRDDFTDTITVCHNFPWISFTDRAGCKWNDDDNAGLHNFLEKKYDILDREKIREGLSLSAMERRYHPIRDYIKAQIWDGVERVDTLLIDFLNAEDTEYVRAVTAKALIGACARVFEPGVKHDHVLVLVGPQGCRKSTTVAKLAVKADWYSDSLFTMSGKDAYEQIQGKWVMELSELAAFRRSDMETMKNFISKTHDMYRPAYARFTVDKPRQCAFIGTTNDEEFLNDPTGNRRFWPVKVGAVPAERYAVLDDAYIAQVWAEVFHRYAGGDTWYLNEYQEAQAKDVQSQFTYVNAQQGALEVFLESPVPPGWNDMTDEARTMHYNTWIPGEEPADWTTRDRVCPAEIWKEFYKGPAKDLTRIKAIEINSMLAKAGWSKRLIRSKCYGIVKGYMRV